MISTTKIKSMVPKEPTPYSVRQTRYQEGRLNSYQDFLFKRVMYGLTVYTKEQLAVMKPVKKFKVLKQQKRAHDVLNAWKQELLTQETNKLLSALFPNSNLIKEILNEPVEPDLKFKCKTPIESFGKTKLDIIEKFIEKGVLSPDFPILEEVE